MIMIIQIGEKILKASLVDNSSTRVLKEKLQNSPITIEMEDYPQVWKKLVILDLIYQRMIKE